MKTAFLEKTFVSIPPPQPIVETMMRRVGIKKPSKMIMISDNSRKSETTERESSQADGQMAFEL